MAAAWLRINEEGVACHDQGFASCEKPAGGTVDLFAIIDNIFA